MDESNLMYLKKRIIDDIFTPAKADAYIHSPDFTKQAWLFDFRIFLQPDLLDRYADLFIETHKHQYPFQVGGLETAAIPLVAAIVTKSHSLGLPISGFFIRKSRKKTGLLKMVEGTIQNLPVILVDDLINSGSSFKKQIPIIESLQQTNPGLDKLKVASVHAIIRFRDTAYYTYLNDKQIPITSFFELNDFSELHLQNLTEPTKRTTAEYKIDWHWRGPRPALEHISPKAGLVLNDKYIYTLTDDGIMFCLKVEDGTEVWRYKVANAALRRGQFSTPIIHEGIIYFGAQDGNIYALDALHGKRIWVSFEADWVGSQITIDSKRNLLFVQTENGLFKKYSCALALNLKDGSTLWSKRLSGPATAAPLLFKNSSILVLSQQNGTILFIHPSTGETIKEINVAPLELYAPPSVSSDNHSLIISGVGASPTSADTSIVYRYNSKDQSLTNIFSDITFGSFGGSSVLADIAIITSLDKHIYAISVTTGKLVWKIDTESRIFSQPYLTEIDGSNRLFIGTNGGQLYEINPMTGAVLSNTYVVERVTNPPVYDKQSRSLFILTYTNEIFKVQLP